jgi:periplasmic mercuric ion binding protein
MFRILGLLSFLGFTQQINAQCCSAGNPASTNGSGGVNKNNLLVSASYVHSYSDTYFEENSVYNGDEWLSHLEKSKFHFGLLNFSYGLTDKLSIATEFGYFIAKSMEYTFFDNSRNAGGFGDAAVDIKYQIADLNKQLTTVFASVKTTLPIGEFDKVDQGVVLPIDIQPSSGSFRLNTSLSIYKRFYGSKLSLNSYISSEFSQRIHTERTDYKYGNLYTLVLGLTHKTSKKVSTGLGINYTHREKALNRAVIVDATGGDFINIQPRINYRLPDDFSLMSSLNFPVYRNTNSIQLTNKFIFVLGVSKGFNTKTIKPILDNVLLDSFNESSFFVDGICGMCKTRIEDLAYRVKGVKWAEWSLETKQLNLKFEDIPNTEKLAKILAKAGHDNWLISAKEKAYNGLHSCCKYRSEH